MPFQKGNKFNSLRKNTKHSLATRLKMSLAAKGNTHGFKKGELIGEKNPAWKDGATLRNHGFRRTYQYKLLTKKIKTRDNFTCRFCGRSDIKLEIDHRLPSSLFPQERINPKNLNTLCINCHKMKTKLDTKFIKGILPIELLKDVIYPERLAK